MDLVTSRQETVLHLGLSGNLDKDGAKRLEEEVPVSLQQYNALIFDFAAVSAISSSGIRAMLAIQEKIAGPGRMVVRNVSSTIMQIFQTSGFLDLVRVEPAAREISTSGYILLGSGVSGECYQVDDETLLKLFFEHVSDDLAWKEKGYAKAAFEAGIPTAISYDVVTSGKRKGILFEKLDGRTLSQVIVDDPDNIDHHVRMFADLSKHIHLTPGDARIFPKTKEVCIEAVRTVDFLTDRQRAAIITKVEEIPDAATCVHGDLHTSNIMLQGDQACLIDMADFSIGYHMFDVAQVYNIFYSSLETGISEKAVGMDPELAFRVWTLFEHYYFDIHTEAERSKIREEAAFFGSLRMFMFYEAFGKEPHMKQWLLERFVPQFGT